MQYIIVNKKQTKSTTGRGCFLLRFEVTMMELSPFIISFPG